MSFTKTTSSLLSSTSNSTPVSTAASSGKDKKVEKTSTSLTTTAMVIATPSRIYLGREVVPVSSQEYSLVLSSLSLVDRLGMKFSHTLGMDLTTVQADPMMGMVWKVVSKQFNALAKAGFFASFSRGQLDGDEMTLQERNELGFGQMMDQIASIIQQQFRRQGFRSMAEVKAKAEKIGVFRKEAEKEMIKNQVKLLAQADQAMLMASGFYSEENSKILTNYWELIGKSSDGYQLNKEVEKHVGLTSITIIMDQNEQFMESMQTQNISTHELKVKFAKEFVETMHAKLQQKFAELMKQYQNVKTEKERICLKYVMLQGQLKGLALINMNTRNIVNQLSKMHEDRLAMWQRVYEKLLPGDIERNKEKIATGGGWRLEAAREAREEGNETEAQEHEAECKKEIEFYKEELKKNEEALKDVRTHVEKLFGSTKDIQEYAPKTSAHETALLEFMGGGITIPGLSTNGLTDSSRSISLGSASSSSSSSSSAMMNLSQDGTVDALPMPSEMQMPLSALSSQYFVKKMMDDAKQQIDFFSALAQKKATIVVEKETSS